MLEMIRGRYGWTESLWINKWSFEDSLVTLEALALCRMGLTTAAVRLVGLRVTHPNFPRASKFSYPNRTGTYEDAGTAAPFTTLLLRFVSAGYHANYRLSGLPRDLIRSTEFVPNDKWNLAFRSYEEGIVANCVMVNKQHLPEDALPDVNPDAVVNSIQCVQLARLTLHKCGGPHFRPRGRARSRKKPARGGPMPTQAPETGH
jgi:hypothetical protein